METYRLQQFQTIVASGSFRKASEILGISHSGLSKSMAVLEDDLGRELFAPSGRGVVVTDAGWVVHEKAGVVLEAEASLRSARKQNASSQLRIGTFEVFSTYFATELVQSIAANEYVFHEMVPGEIETALLKRKIDIGLTYEPLPKANIDYLNICPIEMDIYTLKGAFRECSFKDLAFAAPVAPISGSPTIVRGLDGWRDDEMPRFIKYRVTLMETALALARAGQCAVFIPTFIAKLHNQNVIKRHQLERRKFRGASTEGRRAYVVKRSSTPEDQRIRKVAKVLRTVLKS